MIKLIGIAKSYLIEGKLETALIDFNLSIQQGDFLQITCNSSIEKRAITNIIGMLETPESGSYNFFDSEIYNLGSESIFDVRKNNIGFVFQRYSLIDELTTFENVALALIYRNGLIRKKKEKVNSVLEFCELSHVATNLPADMEPYLHKKVALARALVNKPKIILTDTVNMNETQFQKTEFLNLLFRLNDAGATLVSVVVEDSGANDGIEITSINSEINFKS